VIGRKDRAVALWLPTIFQKASHSPFLTAPCTSARPCCHMTDLHDRIASLTRQVDANPESIGVLSTGEQCVLPCFLDGSTC
jgi:hypothetical protein